MIALVINARIREIESLTYEELLRIVITFRRLTIPAAWRQSARVSQHPIAPEFMAFIVYVKQVLGGRGMLYLLWSQIGLRRCRGITDLVCLVEDNTLQQHQKYPPTSSTKLSG